MFFFWVIVSQSIYINKILSILWYEELVTLIVVCLSNKSNMPQAMKLDTYLEMEHNQDGKSAINVDAII